MNNMSASILTWGPFIVQIVLLSLQIYTYRRTEHYSLALLAAGTTTGILASGSARILNAEVLAASVRVGLYDAIRRRIRASRDGGRHNGQQTPQ
jgi:hypothetical protein